jgi:hypothetical protein
MFELGVRLAARPSGTFYLIDAMPEGDESFNGSRAELRDLLNPFSYDLSTFSFSKAFASRDPNPNSNPVYEAAARHFRTGQDHYDERVDALLVAAAAVTPGHQDPLQSVDITALYARDNRTYGKEIGHSVFERLCAAWYYLADREEPHMARPIDLLDWRRAEAFRRFFNLGSTLKTGLAHRYGPRDKRLQQRIEDAEICARASGAMEIAGLLEKWTELRRNPPWVEAAQVGDKDRADFIGDCELDLAKLKALEVLLEQLANPVCELPLQGVRLDRRRVEIVLEQSNGRIR